MQLEADPTECGISSSFSYFDSSLCCLSERQRRADYYIVQWTLHYSDFGFKLHKTTALCLTLSQFNTYCLMPSACSLKIPEQCCCNFRISTEQIAQEECMSREICRLQCRIPLAQTSDQKGSTLNESKENFRDAQSFKIKWSLWNKGPCSWELTARRCCI